MAVPTFNPNNVTMMNAKTGNIPQEFTNEIMTDIMTGSAFMQLAKQVPMDKPEKVFTHMSGVGAYWVDEGERKKTSKPTWMNVTMKAKKLAVIIPTTEENLAFSVTNFFELMRPAIAEAFYKKFDAAAFADIDNPYAFSIKEAATAAGTDHIITESDNKYDDINDAMAAIEAADLEPNGIASLNSQKSKYRATKDSNGVPIFNEPRGGEPDTVLGLPVAYLPNKTFAESNIAEIVGDWNEAYYGILQNIEYKILDQATLTTIEASDAPGVPVSLAERNMVAIMAHMYIGMIVMKDDAFSIITKTVTP